jgi:hypothetical protein
MNKQSIQDIDAALDRWHAKLNMAMRKINELRDKRKKILKGYIKSPLPEQVDKGVKVKLSFVRGTAADLDLNDPIPSFGGNPAIE